MLNELAWGKHPLADWVNRGYWRYDESRSVDHQFNHEINTIGRPRNVDWVRAAALIYGDWGTSKAYVIGLALSFIGFASLPHLLAVCALTGLVGINYIWICKHFPNGGGVYTAAGLHSLLYVMARDREFPSAFSELNGFGVPWIPLLVSTILPVVVMWRIRWKRSPRSTPLAWWGRLPSTSAHAPRLPKS